MGRLFAVTRKAGSAWRDEEPMEKQQLWPEHASFMRALHEGGFVIYGGPLARMSEVLLIVRAGSEDEIRARLADDPWSQRDILPVDRVAEWTLRMGTIDTPAHGGRL